MDCAVALVALGVGYLVLLQANKEKEGLKILGQVIAILVMLGASCSFLCASLKCMKGDHCGKSMSGKAPMCPMSGKMMDHDQQ